MKNLLTALFILLSTSIYAQDTLKWYAINQYFSNNSSITVLIKVENFDSIFEFQYGLKFDTTFLTLDSVSFYGTLPGYDLDGFGFSWIPPHLIPKNNMSTLWTDAYGLSLPNGTRVYNLHFTTHQSGWLKDVLFPSTDILVFEAIDETLEEIPIKFEVIDELQPEPLVGTDEKFEGLIHVYPNPFHDYLNMFSTISGSIFILNSDGKIESEYEIQPGMNRLYLTGNPGLKLLYFYNSNIKMLMNVIKI